MSVAGCDPTNDETAFPVPNQHWSDYKYTSVIIYWQWVRERSWEREAVSANTHDLIRTSGIIEQLRAGRAAQSSQHAQSRTFNPETHYTAIITVTRHTSSPWKYLNAKY